MLCNSGRGGKTSGAEDVGRIVKFARMDSSFLISLMLLSASVLPAEHGTSFARTPAPSDSLGITVADSLGPIAADSLGILVSDSLGPEVSAIPNGDAFRPNSLG